MNRQRRYRRQRDFSAIQSLAHGPPVCAVPPRTPGRPPVARRGKSSPHVQAASKTGHRHGSLIQPWLAEAVVPECVPDRRSEANSTPQTQQDRSGPPQEGKESVPARCHASKRNPGSFPAELKAGADTRPGGPCPSRAVRDDRSRCKSFRPWLLPPWQPRGSLPAEPCSGQPRVSSIVRVRSFLRRCNAHTSDGLPALLLAMSSLTPVAARCFVASFGGRLRRRARFESEREKHCDFHTNPLAKSHKPTRPRRAEVQPPAEQARRIPFPPNRGAPPVSSRRTLRTCHGQESECRRQPIARYDKVRLPPARPVQRRQSIPWCSRTTRPGLKEIERHRPTCVDRSCRGHMRKSGEDLPDRTGPTPWACLLAVVRGVRQVAESAPPEWIGLARSGQGGTDSIGFTADEPWTAIRAARCRRPRKKEWLCAGQAGK